MRVNQLDAQTLDDDLYELLWGGLRRIARHEGSQTFNTYGAELKTALRLLIFWNTIGRNKPTPGLELQNLCLAGTGKQVPRPFGGGVMRLLTRRQRILYCGLSVIAPWLFTRLKSFLTDWEWISEGRGSLRRGIYDVVYSMDHLWGVASLFHFLHFLAGGKYRSLIERLLRIRIMYINPKAHRALSFEFMNQYLVWRTVVRFLLFILPFMDIGAVFTFMNKILGVRTRRNTYQDSKTCGVCGLSPISIPVRSIPCGHVFCYTCISSILGDRKNNSMCPMAGCSVKIRKTERLTYSAPTERPETKSARPSNRSNLNSTSDRDR
ncbi:hypothetical protein AAMO2058_001159500 [Amorphochlora amoebiformis]